MDPRLVDFYDQELKYLRETAREFGAAYPTLAARLGVNTPGEADPYVERLLEGVAFLAARVQLKLNDEFPKFTQHLIDAVYPHYLCPTPAIAVLAFEPKPADPALNDGVVVPRGSACSIPASEPNRADCIFTTGEDVRLWPIRVAKVDYLANRAAVAAAAGGSGVEGEGGFLIRLETTGADGFDKLKLSDLTFYLGGAESLAGRIYEQIAGNAVGVSIADAASRSVVRVGGREVLRNPAYDDASALLPVDRRSFRGYRVLQEYFACPERFQFINVQRLAPALSQVSGKSVEILIATSSVDKRLAGALSGDAFRLFCAPAINLFRKRCDPVLLDSGSHEFRVLPERVRPLDYEVYSLLEVFSDGASNRPRRTYHPVYRADPRLRDEAATGFYAMRRAPTRTSALYPAKRASDYSGTDLWISLSQLPQSRGQPDQLSVVALCTNRDIADALRGSGAQLEFRLADVDAVIWRRLFLIAAHHADLLRVDAAAAAGEAGAVLGGAHVRAFALPRAGIARHEIVLALVHRQVLIVTPAHVTTVFAVGDRLLFVLAVLGAAFAGIAAPALIGIAARDAGLPARAGRRAIGILRVIDRSAGRQQRCQSEQNGQAAQQAAHRRSPLMPALCGRFVSPSTC